MMRNRKRISAIVIHPIFAGGGSENVCAWTLQALQDSYDLSLLTCGTVSVQHLNQYYGTNLSETKLQIIQPFPTLLINKWGKHSFSLLKHHLLIQYCKEKINKPALFISTYGEMDVGSPAIQYVHFPLLSPHKLEKIGFHETGKWCHKPSFLRQLYVNFAKKLSCYSEKRMKTNLILANSNWTAEIFRRIYDMEAKVLYPPVHNMESDIMSWDEREDGFLCIGRVEQRKRILEIIRILKDVRLKGFPIHLHIIGPNLDTIYMRQIQKEISNQPWVILEGTVTRSKLSSLIASHKFGIHGMPYEHFGISIAEMAKAGCVVFVPDGGGQVEIVGYDKRVIYQDKKNAVVKITSILTQPKVQIELSQKMKTMGNSFSSERFISEIRNKVEQFVSSNKFTLNINHINTRFTD